MWADSLRQVWEEIAARPEGPLAFRFYIQPCMATYLAVRDGLKDARAGRHPYFWTLFTDAPHRWQLLHHGWKSIGKVFLFAAALDLVYQFVVLHGFFPVQTLFVSTLLAIIPYLTFRGPANRIARAIWRRRQPPSSRRDAA